MFTYSDHCGLQPDFISVSDLDSVVSYMHKLDPSPIPPYGECYGIDVNHNTDVYKWFQDNIMDKLRSYTGRADLNLIFGHLADVTQSFKIHKDVKPIPEREQNPQGVQFASFLIPVSVDNKPELCATNSTLVFKKDLLPEPTEHKLWHDRVKNINPLHEHSKHGWLDHRRYELIDEFVWKKGDLIWWNSLYPHSGCDSESLKITNKQMIVVHTYV